MTMYYSKAEMDYVEFQRTQRCLEAAKSGDVDVVETPDGPRYRKDGKDWQPDMSYLAREQS